MDAAEGGATGLFTVHRSSDVGALTVNYSTPTGTATNGADYSGAGATGGSVAFAYGDWTKSIVITAFDDTLLEAIETVTLALAGSSAYAITGGGGASININDNDVPDVWITGDTHAAEGGATGLFTVHRSSGVGELNVGYDKPYGTATNGADYSSIAGNYGGAVGFVNGELTKSILINPVDDALAEGTETVFVLLSGKHSGYTISGSTASININDNEVPPTVWITGDNDASEGGVTGIFKVHRSSGVGTLTVYYSAPTGTAINGADYTGAAANGSSVSFINGETSKLVTVTAVNDTLVEGTELVTMTLANGNGYTIETGRASINIADDDQPDYVITHWLTIYDANLTGQSIYDIHPGERDGAFFAGEKAPTSTVNTMEEIADKLVAVLGDKATANIELKARTKQVKDSKTVLFRDVDELKSDAIKAKKRFLQVATAEATSGERTAGYFMWGQTIDLPNYNGTVIQQIEYTDTIYIKGAAKPRVDKTQILVEGFFLKGGRTNLDLHDVAIDFKNADMDKIERVYKITLGAGTYNGKGVEKFEILEPKHDGPLEGVVAWAGATTEIVVKLMLSSSETPRATYSGPWGN